MPDSDGDETTAVNEESFTRSRRGQSLENESRKRVRDESVDGRSAAKRARLSQQGTMYLLF